MGDLSQHSRIYRHFAAGLHKRGVEANFDYLYIGNFLTDLSQFVDPFASMSAKPRVRLTAYLKRNITQDAVDTPQRWYIDGWLDALLGAKGDDKRIGALSRYLRSIALGMTQFVFADDIPKKTWQLIFPPSVSGPAAAASEDLRFVHFIPPGEVAATFQKYFTQYYPHEHLDMPPIEMNNGNYTGGLYDRTPSSGLIQYMDSYKRYMAEELSKLQRDWRKIRNVPLTDPRIKELHVRLDKVLHPLEDYFYHSNFVEGLIAQDLLRANQNAAAFDPPLIDAYVAEGMAADLPRYFRGANRNATKPVVASAPAWIRKALRRMRFPIYDKATPSSKESTPDADCVYTGGFAGDDIFHTVIGALDSLEQMLAPIIAVKKAAQAMKSLATTNSTASTPEPAIKRLVLLRALMDRGYRNTLAETEALAHAQQLHLDQLASGAYQAELDRLVQAGFMNAAGRAAFADALALDQAFSTKWNKDAGMGVGGFLLAVLSRGQIAENASQKAAAKLDSGGTPQPLSDDFLATDNGTSSELIGTHTLMSKDSGHSLPFHLEAQTLGRFAAYLVAQIFFTAVNGPVGVGPLAFDRLLNRVMRFPTLYGWEMKVLKFYRKNGRDPEFEDVAVDPQRMITALAVDDSATLNSRIDKFHTKADLEQKYRRLEENTT